MEEAMDLLQDRLHSAQTSFTRCNIRPCQHIVNVSDIIFL